MKIMFWNVNRNNINIYISNLIRDYNIDVLVMAEYTSDRDELSNLLAQYNQNLVVCNTQGCERIDIWSNYVNIKPGIQNKYYSIQVIQDKYIVCGVHLMTDLYGDHSDERLVISQQIMQDIKDIEKEVGSSKTIIIGDFNEMPYNKGCLNANGFHGLPALNAIDSAERTVDGIKYRKFYNPMWNFMGDFSYPPGTYYLNQSKLYSPMWYMLDQVIISMDILPLFKRESLKIITTCSYSDLMDEKLHPNRKISDHFPIMCEIEDN